MKSALAVVMLAALAGDAVAAEPVDLFADLKGKENVPDGLKKTYAAFVDQIKTGGVDAFLLPHSVPVSNEPRPEKTREYGQNINVAFLRSHFTPRVLNFRKDPDDCYLIRTGTTAIWFVETKSGAWKIYRYLDKPIE